MYKAVLFDFDGVLTVDSTGTTSIINYIEEKTDIEKDKFEKAYRKHNWNLLYGGKTHEEIWGDICIEMSQEIDVQILHKSFLATPIDFKMIELAVHLKNEGYKIGMVTDNKSDRIKQILDFHEYNDLFDAVVISANVGSGKSEKKIFETILEKLKLEFEDCIFIDNNKKNLIIPNQEGMRTVYYDHDKRDLEGLKEKLKAFNVSI